MDDCRCRKEAAVAAVPLVNALGKDAMQESLVQRFVRRAGMLGLAVLMIAISGGLGYVAHLTQVTSQKVGDGSPSVLPLIALSILAAVAGIATVRLALHRDGESA